MKDNTRNLHSNTVAFSCFEPATASLILTVIGALASFLRWRQVSKSFLIEILDRLSEADSFEMTHGDFSKALWPNLKESSREDKFIKWSAKFKEDMMLSNCFPVEIPPPRKSRHLDGSFKTLPTLYVAGIFWNLFRAVQDEALKCDLLSLELSPRRAQVRVIVKEYLLKIQARPIEKYKKKEKVLRPNPSLPCRCACAHCASCAAKAPAVEGDRPAQKCITKHDVSERMGAAFEELFQCGVDWANLNLDMMEYWRKLMMDQEMIQERMALAVKRHNAPRKVKMNGGQPK